MTAVVAVVESKQKLLVSLQRDFTADVALESEPQTTVRTLIQLFGYNRKSVTQYVTACPDRCLYEAASNSELDER